MPWLSLVSVRAFVGLVLLLAADWLGRAQEHPLAALPRMRLIRWTTYYALVAAILFLGAFGFEQFIYFQF